MHFLSFYQRIFEICGKKLFDIFSGTNKHPPPKLTCVGFSTLPVYVRQMFLLPILSLWRIHFLKHWILLRCIMKTYKCICASMFVYVFIRAGQTNCFLVNRVEHQNPNQTARELWPFKFAFSFTLNHCKIMVDCWGVAQIPKAIWSLLGSFVKTGVMSCHVLSYSVWNPVFWRNKHWLVLPISSISSSCRMIVWRFVVLISACVFRPNSSPKTQPNGSPAVVWLRFWFSTRFTRKIVYRLPQKNV